MNTTLHYNFPPEMSKLQSLSIEDAAWVPAQSDIVGFAVESLPMPVADIEQTREEFKAMGVLQYKPAAAFFVVVPTQRVYNGKTLHVFIQLQPLPEEAKALLREANGLPPLEPDQAPETEELAPELN